MTDPMSAPGEAVQSPESANVAAEEPEAYVPASGEDAVYLESTSEEAVPSPGSDVVEEPETPLPRTNERPESPESAPVGNVIELGRTEGVKMTDSSEDIEPVQPETRYYLSHLPPVY